MRILYLFLPVVPVGLIVLCGTYCGYEYGLYAIPIVLAMFFGVPFASFVHELGHMLFGALVGIKAVPKFSIFSASCCKIMPKTYTGLRSKTFFTAIGGVTVNLLFIILGIVALCVPECPLWLTVFMPGAGWIFVFNVIPYDYNRGKTDGRVLVELAKNDDEAKVLIAVLTVQAQVLKGKPIEEVDENLLFGVPQIMESEQAFIALTQLRYEYFKAKGNNEEAEKYRQRFEQLKEEYL